MAKQPKKVLSPIEREIKRRESAIASMRREVERITQRAHAELAKLEEKIAVHETVVKALKQPRK